MVIMHAMVIKDDVMQLNQTKWKQNHSKQLAVQVIFPSIKNKYSLP
jgi:hypothetical protein